ncbi:MAG: hypothetical protein ACP5RX_02155 [Minisyncoccia bacterium]
MKLNLNPLLNFLYILKIISLILLPILLIGIIYLMRKLNIVSKKIENIKNWFGVHPFLSSSSKSLRQWEEIENLLEETYQSSWKLSVIKADALVQNFLKQLGYQGDTFTELTESLQRRGFKHLDILSGAHQVCEEILNNRDFSFSQEEAKNIIKVYKRFWDEVVGNIL